MAKDGVRSTKAAGVIRGDSVRVWSEVGVSVPIGDTFAHLRFTFGHERIAKNDSTVEIKRVAALVDEFNSEELERRLENYVRLVKRSLGQIEGDDDDDPKPSGSTPSKSGSVRDRASKRMKK